jgi:proteasome lid subunit RPN8/RPN11
VLEAVRAKGFSHLPPRDGATYLAPTAAVAAEWAKWQNESSGYRYGVFKVHYSGAAHGGDANLVDDVGDALYENDRSAAEKVARAYWRGDLRARVSMPEIVLRGEAIVAGRAVGGNPPAKPPKASAIKAWAKKALALNAQAIYDSEYEGGVFLLQDASGALVERVVAGEEAEVEMPEEPGLIPVALFHSHPDGDPEPSPDDDDVMQRIANDYGREVWLFVVGFDDDGENLVMTDRSYAPEARR